MLYKAYSLKDTLQLAPNGQEFFNKPGILQDCLQIFMYDGNDTSFLSL